MQRLSTYSWTKHIDFMILDSIVLALSFWVSYARVFGTPLFWQHVDWIRYLLFVLSLNVCLMFATGTFSGVLRRPYYMEVVRSFQLTVANALTATFMFYLLKVGAVYSRATSFYMYILSFAFSALLNAVWKKLLLSGTIVVSTTGPVSLFVIGSARTIEETVANVTAGDYMLCQVAGVHLVDGTLSPAARRRLGDVPVVGEDYLQYILNNNIQEVLVAVAPEHVEPGVLERLNANAVNLNVAVESILGFQSEDQYLSHVGVYGTLGIGAFSFSGGQVLYLAVKRVMDIACGLVGIVVLVPVSLAVKLAYVLSGDTAGIFYRQRRLGQNGKVIRIWKFRSMVPDADEVLEELLEDPDYREEWDANQKFEDDPRITRIGAFLRKTSIDEIPQFLNVLVGDMSLVGPRPLVEGELEKFGGLMLYQRVKPGITGWWACNGRSNIDYRERLELEYYYVKNCSISLDVLCILRTVLAIVRREGAK